MNLKRKKLQDTIGQQHLGIEPKDQLKPLEKTDNTNEHKMQENIPKINSEEISALTNGPTKEEFHIGQVVWGPNHGCAMWPGKLVSAENVKGTHKHEDGKVSGNIKGTSSSE